MFLILARIKLLKITIKSLMNKAHFGQKIYFGKNFCFFGFFSLNLNLLKNRKNLLFIIFKPVFFGDLNFWLCNTGQKKNKKSLFDQLILFFYFSFCQAKLWCLFNFFFIKWPNNLFEALRRAQPFFFNTKSSLPGKIQSLFCFFFIY